MARNPCSAGLLASGMILGKSLNLSHCSLLRYKMGLTAVPSLSRELNELIHTKDLELDASDSLYKYQFLAVKSS